MKFVDDQIMVSGPKVLPFSERMRTTCPACGMKPDYLWRRIVRRMRGKKVEEVATFQYCAGEKPPTETSDNPFFSMLAFGNREVINHCAGLMFPHLHCTCKTCRAQWFTSLKSSPTSTHS